MKALIHPSLLHGTVKAPPSKSAGHRSLICAALADRPVTITNCGESDDITTTAMAVTALGAAVTRTGNTVHVTPAAGNVSDISVDCHESGSTARFIIPVAAALGVKNTVFTGSGRLPERPFGTISHILRENGLTCPSDGLPMTVSGQLKPGVFQVPGNISSQYISGLLLACSVLNGTSQIILTSELQSAPYVFMTINELRAFGAEITFDKTTFTVRGNGRLKGTDRTVEGDWSQAAFFLCAGAIGGDITVTGLNNDSLQGDKAILNLLKDFGAKTETAVDGIRVKKSRLHGIAIDASQIPDLVPILAVTAAFAEGKTVIANAGRLRIKESDRLTETASRLKAFGIDVSETEDSLTVLGGAPKAADITSAGDHRIAMAFSVMAAFCDGTSSIDGARAVNKSYPEFFNDFISLGGKCDVIGNR